MIKTVQKGTYSKPCFDVPDFLEDFDRLERPHIEPKKFKKLCVLRKTGWQRGEELDLFSALM